MKDEKLSRVLRGLESPVDPEHRARLEQALLAAYDARSERWVGRRKTFGWRVATAVGVLLCLVTSTRVTAEYKLEMGKRIRLVFPADRTPPPELGDTVARALVSESSHLADVEVSLRREPGGPATLRVDVWGERLAPNDEGLARLRALPELAGLPLDVESLTGHVRDNLWGLLGHTLFRADSSPEELAAAREQLMEALRRQEGEGADIHVTLEPDPLHPRMRIQVRKPAPAP